MRRLSSGVVTYTWTDAEQVNAEQQKSPVWVAANGLYPSDKLVYNPSSNRYRILYVGRLETAKRPELLVDAYLRAISKLPDGVKLTLVGSGSLSSTLEERVEHLGASDQVELLGHIGDYCALKQIYAETMISVSPGYAGLSLTQSLGFGVPMLVADDEPHAPEIELLSPETGAYFAAGSAEALAARLVEVFEGRLRWEPERVMETARGQYSSTAMASGFLAAIIGKQQEEDQ
nr:glycosyltransferase [Nesterenkonia sp. LB17]